jgi:YHS domain-containing protein
VQVHKLILSYDLAIIPVLMKYTPKVELEFPLDAENKEAVATWVDDRLVDFVQTYLSMGENEYHLKESMVEDPITHVRFPNTVAGAMLDRAGTKYYFISDETRRDFAKQNNTAID